MTFIKNTQLNLKPLTSLARALKHDREALLQLLLSMCKANTLNRIENCPTYPVRHITNDLEERLNLIHEGIRTEPFEIANALALLFETATHDDRRKNFGQFFTPQPVAKRVLEHLSVQKDETIVEPGCGTGIFPLLILSENRNDPAFLSSITYLGIENDPLLMLSAAVSMDWLDAPKSWRLLYNNFLHVDFSTLENIQINKIDAIISNPPYVRFHRLKEKKELLATLNLDSYAGLHMFFIAHSSRLLKKGRMIFIVPTEMYGARYGIDLLSKLKNDYLISNEIVYYDIKDKIWVAKEMEKMTMSKYIKINQVWNLLLLNSLTGENKIKSIKKEKQIRINNTIYLGELADVHRGTSTGSNNFFVLNDKQVEEYKIPSDYLIKIMPTKIRKKNLSVIFKTSEWNKFKEEGKSCWLLNISKSIEPENLPNEINEYLRMGERHGVHLIYTSRKRHPWYSVNKSQIPDLFFTYISRGYPRFIFNEARVLHLTNLLGIYMKKNILLSNEMLLNFTKLINDEIINWINTETVGRKYNGGLLKFEPSDLLNLPIPIKKLKKINITFSLGSPFARAKGPLFKSDLLK